jgi:hypothetical protein
MKELLSWLFHGEFSSFFCLFLVVAFPSAFFLVLKIIEKRISNRMYIFIEYLAFISPTFIYLYYSYPGIYNNDSIATLRQALEFKYYDWHPPLLSAIWASLIFLFKTPTALYWSICLLYILGLSLFYIIFKRTGLSQTHLWFTALSCAIVGLMLFGLLIKDVVVAYSLINVCGIVAMVVLGMLKPGLAIIPVTILSFLAIISRYNALPAVVPMLFLNFYYLYSFKRNKNIIALISTATLCIVFLVIQKKITYNVLKSEKWNIKQAIMLHDLAYFQSEKNAKLIPENHERDGYSSDKLRQAVLTRHGEYIFNNRVNPDAPFKTLPGQENNQIEKIWLQTILENPFSYFYHRLLIFLKFLSIGENKAWFPYTPSEFGDDKLRKIGVKIEERLPHAIVVEHIISKSSTFISLYTPIYYGWFWLFINCALLFFSLKKIKESKFSALCLAISFSGFIYLLFYFIIAPCPSFRYFYWTIFASILSFLLLRVSKCASKSLDVEIPP